MNIKKAIISAILIWTLGVSTYIASFYFTFMEDPEMQANLVLLIALIPCVLLGTHFYYKKGNKTNGFKLGVVMFAIAMLLDAVITVPLFIIPEGGNHITFFTDPGFWLIAVEYMLVVVLYWYLRKSRQPIQTRNT